MAKAKSSKKTQAQQLVRPWTLSWPDVDRVFDNFRRDFESAFVSFPTIAPQTIPKLSSTSCDLADEGNRYVVKVDLPGVKKKDVELNITENSIEICAEHKDESEEKKKNFLRKERSEVSYYRTLPLPEKVLANKAKAKLTDGTLNITLPKAKPTPKPKKKSVVVQ